MVNNCEAWQGPFANTLCWLPETCMSFVYVARRPPSLMSAGLVACVVAVAAALLQTVFIAAQEDSLEWRLEHMAGVRVDEATQFFATLRRAVGTSDKRAACALVSYPLQAASEPIADAATCEARYDDIFTIPVRRAIGKQQFQELFASDEGIMIGLGEVWVRATCREASCSDHALRITRLSSDPALALRPPRGKLLLACGVGGQWIRVSADGNGGAYMRLWSGNRGTEPPVAEYASGTRTLRGTEACGAPVWSFTNGGTSYVVSQVGCPDDVDPPPMGSVAKVNRTSTTSEPVEGWCRE